MINFTNTVRINRTVAEVYSYLSDLEHLPEWNWAITDTEKVTPGPISVGTRYRQVRSAPKVEREELEITQLAINQQIGIRGTLAGFPAQILYRLTEVTTGTEVTNVIQLEVRGALRVVSPLLGNRIKGAVANNLAELKVRLEAASISLNYRR